MFGILKKRLREAVGGLARKAEKPEEPRAEKPAKAEKAMKPEKPAREEPKGTLEKITKRITEKEFSAREIDDFFAEIENGLLQANVALEVIDYLKAGMKDSLLNRPVKRSEAGRIINESFEKLLFSIVNQKEADIEAVIKSSRKEKRPACVLFLGYNGSGKTTTIAKLAKMLMQKKYKPVLAAGDTFRAASIEQLEIHGSKLGLNVIKHKYGADPAAVVFDARKHAESKGLDVVLADTAGRMHTNVNLMDELKKIVRVNKPDLKILVVDSLTGNDVVAQVRMFDEGVGIDGLVLTKMDVNEKGGSVFSACYTAKKPILFIGTGQGYESLEKFDPKKFVKGLLE